MNYINQIIENLKNMQASDFLDISVALLIIIAFKIISPIIAYVIIKIFKIKEKSSKKIKSNSFYKPLKAFILILGIYIALIVVNISEYHLSLAKKAFKICTIFLIAKGFADTFDNSSEFYKRILNKLDIADNNVTLNLFGKVIKVLIYIIAGFIIITELGYNLGGLATGLGISSVVIALAAQEVAKNILSGFAILTDKPFKIGDYIQIGTIAGTVENITFRSIRIRNINNEIVVIPNSLISTENLINSSKIEKRFYSLVITLEQNTNAEKVANLTNKISSCLLKNKNILDDSVKVFFSNIGANGLDISINFYTSIVDYVEYLKFKEQINYLILSLLDEEKISLAYNSQSVYLKK